MYRNFSTYEEVTRHYRSIGRDTQAPAISCEFGASHIHGYERGRKRVKWN